MWHTLRASSARTRRSSWNSARVPLLTERIYAVLRSSAIAPGRALDARLAVVYLLGQIGVPDRSELLNEIESSSCPRQTPEEVLTLLASVKVRTGRSQRRRQTAGCRRGWRNFAATMPSGSPVWRPCCWLTKRRDSGPTIEQVVLPARTGALSNGLHLLCLNAMGC